MESQCPHIPKIRGAGGVWGGFFFSLLLSFFPPLVQKLPPSSLVFQRGNSDVTSDGGAAAVRPESCIPAAQDCFRWGRATSLYLDLTEEKNRQRATDSLSVSCVKYMTVNRLLSGKLHTANCSLQLCHVWDRHSDINKYSGVRLC